METRPGYFGLIMTTLFLLTIMVHAHPYPDDPEVKHISEYWPSELKLRWALIA